MSLLATVAATTVTLTLLASAAGHARHHGRLTEALVRHAVVPPRLAGEVAATVVGVEAALGLAVALELPRPSGPWALAGAAALFAAYAGYTEYLRRTRADAPPCGCAGDDVAVTGWVVGRAATLAAVALLGAGLDAGTGTTTEVAVALCAGAVFACLLWQLPAAMSTPTAGSTPDTQPTVSTPDPTAADILGGRR